MRLLERRQREADRVAGHDLRIWPPVLEQMAVGGYMRGDKGLDGGFHAIKLVVDLFVAGLRYGATCA